MEMVAFSFVGSSNQTLVITVAVFLLPKSSLFAHFAASPFRRRRHLFFINLLESLVSWRSTLWVIITRAIDSDASLDRLQ
ncbi:hypothetical protein L596_030011 [Steinernema carpocapsae]|uniref:Uncharacterized protein n=1 Tax=Steinernema carpocapsae TaxID=34508 RepID=A0A4V5ZX61_STECR|nr:hypothetical protein L596_030011 [Steinernema carpocapsae]